MNQRSRQETMMGLWAVYERPSDYPSGFIARRFDVAAGGATPTSDVLRGESLEAVRAQLPAGLYLIPRSEEDEPQIVESWIY